MSNLPPQTMALAARSVRSAISTGSLSGTIVVRNATRSLVSGSTGIGSWAARQARDTVSTFISRNSCMTMEKKAIPPRSRM